MYYRGLRIKESNANICVQLMAVLHMKNMQMNQAASADELIAGVKSANDTLEALSKASDAMKRSLDSTKVSHKTLKDASKQQLECMIDMNQEAAYQGDLFSFFTVITTLFLPLGFLSQVSYSSDIKIPRIITDNTDLVRRLELGCR
jgi:negative regulator of sigma E activity